MNDSISYKKCPRCQKVKPLSGFWTNKARSSGIDSYCKECKKLPPKGKEIYPEGHKKCFKCLEIKSFSEFYPANGTKTNSFKLTAWCITCIRKNSLDRMAKRTYEYRRSVNMRFRYGITREEYNQIYEKQNGQCAICHKPETKKQYSKVMELGIDHDHVSGKTRGLLCADCNRAIGLLKDETKRVNNLLAYINKPILNIDQIACKNVHSTKGQRSKLKKYGLTPEVYQALFEAQNGVCATCELAETAMLHGTVKMLAVDHSHTAGEIRGLLCQACNRALGLLKDSPTLLENTLKYLQQYSL